MLKRIGSPVFAVAVVLAVLASAASQPQTVSGEMPAPRPLQEGLHAFASSEYNSSYDAENVLDGIIGQSAVGEWASLGESNPYIFVTFPSAVTINTIILYDRPNPYDNANGGLLSLSTGTEVSVSGIPTDGKAKVVTFPASTVTWVLFQVSGGVGPNVGLSEMQFFRATASSEYNSSYVAGNVLDGIIGQSAVGEWASLGQSNPWIQITFPIPVTINTIRLYDRPNPYDNANGGTLSFSSGANVAVSGIPTDGRAKLVTFPARTISWFKFQVSGGVGPNVGLSEIQYYRVGEIAEASSEYNSSYAAYKAYDGIIGLSAVGEWASLGQSNPWIKVWFPDNMRVKDLLLYDRPNPYDNANGGTLYFSDGSSVAVSGIPTDGSAKLVTFSTKTLNWLKFQVSGGVGPNVGFSEVQVPFWGSDTNKIISRDTRPQYAIPQNFYIGHLGTGGGGYAPMFEIDAASAAGPLATYAYWTVVGPGYASCYQQPDPYGWGSYQAQLLVTDATGGQYAPYIGGKVLFADIEEDDCGWGDIITDGNGNVIGFTGDYARNREVLRGFLDTIALATVLDGNQHFTPGVYTREEIWQVFFGEWNTHQPYNSPRPIVLYVAGRIGGVSCNDKDKCDPTRDYFDQTFVLGKLPAVIGKSLGGYKPVIWQYWLDFDLAILDPVRSFYPRQ